MAFQFFTLDEFSCPCCGENKIDKAFVHKLDHARSVSNVPFIITSGYRCKNHNHDIGGKSLSSHLDGLAADIGCVSSVGRLRILCGLIKAGFNRIGIRSDFIHVDVDQSKPSDVLWIY